MIIKCQNWEEILPYARDWILLDLNQVIFDGVDLALSSRCHGIRQSYKKKWKEEGTYLKLWGSLLKQWRFKLIDSRIPEWINDWKNAGHTIIGLTAHPTGNFGKLKDIGKERIRPIKEFNIEFTKQYNNYVFKNLPMPHPELKDGVLISGSHLKGIVLSNFFKKILRHNTRPKHILFVDDQKSNLESVKKCCDIWKIEYTGILFKSIKSDIEIDPEVIRAQFEEFEKTGVWIGDQETVAKSV